MTLSEDMRSGKQPTVVCSRVDDVSALDTLPDSTIARCCECGARVWLTKGGGELYAKHDWRIACLPCVIDSGGARNQFRQTRVSDSVRDRQRRRASDA